MQRIREVLALVLVILLPFHAFGVTVATRVFVGENQPPLPLLAFWKEAMLAMALLLALMEIVRGWLAWRRGDASYELRDTSGQPIRQAQGRRLAVSDQSPSVERGALRTTHCFRVDVLDGLILALFVLGIAVSFWEGVSLGSFALGIRYDFVFLLSFLLLRRVEWSAWFRSRLPLVLVAVGGTVAAYGFFTLLLPDSWFMLLGYSDLHSLYQVNAPIAAFQYLEGGGMARVQSVLSGPNHLGIWLLVPLSVVLSWGWMYIRKSSAHSTGSGQAMSHEPSVFLHILAGILMAAGLVLTFSRSAWLGFATMIAALLLGSLSARRWMQLFGAGVIGVMFLTALFPDVFLRASSSRGHIERPLEALAMIQEHPFGQGLGTAGPASHRGRDTCVHLRADDDPSWAVDRPELCVFLGNEQVQPIDRACDCPFLPENWALQLGIEMGWAGLVLWVVFTVIVLWKLWARGANDQSSPVSQITFLAFLGVTIASLFLHAWEDAAVAYTMAILLAVSLGFGNLSLWRPKEPSSSSISADNTHTL